MSELGDVLPATHGVSTRVTNQGAWHAPDGHTIVPEPRINDDRAESSRRPWYFSTKVIVLAYFVFSPLGSLLILTDRRRSKKAKIRAIAVTLFSFGLLYYRLAIMPPLHF